MQNIGVHKVVGIEKQQQRGDTICALMQYSIINTLRPAATSPSVQSS